MRFDSGATLVSQMNITGVTQKRKSTYYDDVKGSDSWKDKVILIAEDDEVNYRFLELVLQKTRALILRAKNGLEAVELCKKIKKIDIVLMDIRMPHMDGYEATSEILKFRPGIPIIAQTAYAGHDERMKCNDAGCRDFLTKPIDIDLLINKISNFF